ncbi:MAG: DNA mismatch repair protein MutT [Planctomycetaceae bacterium]|nr:DNA mismatch repair protein MutT [Planctomycetaceae bacterium]|tara:strand:+ start:533 stop:1048 length:516 start_codon:yes stop_codon:yes gene_type:complete
MPSASTKKPVSCGILLFRKHKGRKQFLLMEHVRRWDLPKGHVDPGESEIECALREFEEETGLDRRDIKLQKKFRYESYYRVKNWKRRGVNVEKKLVIFLARLKRNVSGKVIPTEHIGYQWVDWDPPHDIQEKTINPLLKQVADFQQRKQKMRKKNAKQKLVDKKADRKKTD